MRFARLLTATVLLVAIFAAGCGSSDSGEGTSTQQNQGEATNSTATAPAGATTRSCESGTNGVAELRVTGVDCSTGKAVVATWSHKPSCASPAGASRFSCAAGDYRCLGAATDRGIAVGCARPNRSIAFVAKRR
jgi:hypothetical protein